MTTPNIGFRASLPPALQALLQKRAPGAGLAAQFAAMRRPQLPQLGPGSAPAAPAPGLAMGPPAPVAAPAAPAPAGSKATRNALLAGAQGAVRGAFLGENLLGTLAGAAAGALLSGAPAFAATKDAEAEADAERGASAERERAYRAALDSPEVLAQLGPGPVRMLRAMPAAEGAKLLAQADLLKPREAEKPTVVGADAVAIGGDGRVLYDNRRPEERVGYKPDSAFQTAAIELAGDQDPASYTSAQRQQIAARADAIRRSGATNVRVDAGQRGENSFFDAYNRGLANEHLELGKLARAGREENALLDETIRLVPDAITGAGAGWRREVLRYVRQLPGGENVGADLLENTDVAAAGLQQILVNGLKSHLGSQLSNKDIDEYREAVGSLGKDPKALVRVLERRRGINNRVWERFEREDRRIRSGAGSDNYVPPIGGADDGPKTKQVTIGGKPVTAHYDDEQGVWFYETSPGKFARVP